MKLFNKQISIFLTSVCSAILSFLGFSSCTNNEVMYGMPTGTFEIKGVVTSEEGNAVENAEIRVTPPDAPSGVYSLQTTTTNLDGQYITKGQSYAEQRLKVVCIPSNPKLEADSVIVKMNYNKDKADTWYVGYAEEVVDFKLKEKSTPEP